MSCLFDSIAYFVKLDGFSVRQIICNYLEANNPIMEGLDTKTILSIEDPEYIKKMRITTTFGGGPELKAASNIWNIKIIVFINKQLTEKIEFIPLSNTHQGHIELFWTGNHYDPIVRQA